MMALNSSQKERKKKRQTDDVLEKGQKGEIAKMMDVGGDTSEQRPVPFGCTQ